jgi:hypothetical protein
LPAPNLLHPIPIEIEQIDRSGTIVDDDYREEVQVVARSAAVTVPGQVKWGAHDRATLSALGADAHSDGYVVFRRDQLRAAGVEDMRQGDRLLAFGAVPNRIEVNVFVEKVQPFAHYGPFGGATLVRVFFRDRSPARQNPS